MQNISSSRMSSRLKNSVHQRVYLDHNATTPYSVELQQRWADLIEIFGNPSSIHQESRVPKTILRETRQKIADYLCCSPLEIIFNSGASEGNSSILKSVFEYFKQKNEQNYQSNKLGQSNDTRKQIQSYRNEYIISQVEHPSVLRAAEYLRSNGATVHLIPVNRDGEIDLNFIREKLSDKTALVSVMYANNETGTIFPIKLISEMAHSVGALMHSDCVQMLGKVDINFQEINVDYACFSAHKFYAFKGTGFCYIRKSSPWLPLIYGGGQERGRRGGTENILGVATLGIALESISKTPEKIYEMQRLRTLMEELIVENNSNVTITAHKSHRLCNTSSLVVENVDGETLLMSLDLKGFSVSTGAACSSGNPEPSPVLLAMGLTRAQAQSSLRLSLGWETTEEQIRHFVIVLTETIQRLRQINLEDRRDHYA